MDRAPHTNLKVVLTSILIAIVVIGGGTWALLAHQAANQVTTTTDSQHLLTQISYHGQTGVDALTLLKRHATVGVKHYSFGDLVTSINGSVGNGPKYWTFYVNGKQAEVGAGAYQTKDGDTLLWKLQ